MLQALHYISPHPGGFPMSLKFADALTANLGKDHGNRALRLAGGSFSAPLCAKHLCSETEGHQK